jgi:arylsulfatase A-like enzyme
MPSRPRNLLLLMADDHRSDAMSCAGDAGVSTPNMDRIGSLGLRCSQARIMGGHSPAVCIPTRAALNTGRTPFRSSIGLGGLAEIATLRQEAITLGQTLGQAGWTCFHTGKWHLDARSFNRSFRDGGAIFWSGMGDHCSLPLSGYDPTGFYPVAARSVGNRHSTDVFADEAISFLRRQDGAQPFFLSCSFTAPHDPRQAPAAWHARYPAEAVALPPNFMAEHPFDNGELRVRDEVLCPHPRTPERIRREIADYHAMIAHMDDGIGRILATLAEAGLAEDTIVVYTGDHGLAVGRHGLLGKQNMYEHALRIPLLMAGPGLPIGRVHPGLLMNYDLMPTLLDLCRVPLPEGLDGRSFLPRLADGADNHPCAYAVYRNLQAAIVVDGWKLIRYYRTTDGRGSDRIQLFNLSSDPWELADRAEDSACATQRSELLRALVAEQCRHGDPLAHY